MSVAGHVAASIHALHIYYRILLLSRMLIRVVAMLSGLHYSIRIHILISLRMRIDRITRISSLIRIVISGLVIVCVSPLCGPRGRICRQWSTFRIAVVVPLLRIVVVTKESLLLSGFTHPSPVDSRYSQCCGCCEDTIEH